MPVICPFVLRSTVCSPALVYITRWGEGGPPQTLFPGLRGFWLGSANKRTVKRLKGGPKGEARVFVSHGSPPWLPSPPDGPWLCGLAPARPAEGNPQPLSSRGVEVGRLLPGLISELLHPESSSQLPSFAITCVSRFLFKEFLSETTRKVSVTCNVERGEEHRVKSPE